MPIKVRCPGCQKVLSASDKAAGKKIKCPSCETAIRVPASAGAAGKREAVRKASAPPPSSSALIANLDLDRLEDRETRICPKCSSEVSVEDVECPNCHVNLESGLLSAEKKAELSRKGPNPKLYYKELFRDALAYWKKTKSLSFRVGIHSALWVMLAVFASAGALYFGKPPVRFFFLFVAAIAVLVPPGLAFQLYPIIIDATLRKKKKLGKINLDKFLGTALGLKLILWFALIALPLHIAAVAFAFFDFWIVTVALEATAIAFATMLFPIMMSHMAMPITWKGWMINKMSKPFFRTAPAIMYWALLFWMVLLPPLALIAGVSIYSAKDLAAIVETSNSNASIVMDQMALHNDEKFEHVTKEQVANAGRDFESLSWTSIILPAVTYIVAAGIFGLTAIFSMRTNGLFTYYFLDRLDLDALAPEVKYVPKAQSLEEIESRKGLEWNHVSLILGLVLAMGFALGGAISLSTSSAGFLQGAGWGLLIAGILTSVVGFFWLMIEVFMDSMVWFGAISVAGTASGAVAWYFGTAAFGLSGLLAMIYGLLNWSNCKFPVTTLIVGNIASAVGWGMLIATLPETPGL